MDTHFPKSLYTILTLIAFVTAGTGAAFAAEVVSEAIDLADEPTLTLTEAREAGAQHSSYRNQTSVSLAGGTPEPDLATFHREIKPILDDTCVKCHGPDKQKGDFRIDLLDPDLTHGEDVDWWLDIVDVMANSEMPPDDEEEMPGVFRSQVIDWLSSEIQLASQTRRSEEGHSSFRRMTSYEYNYALQDLLGLDLEFANDLPPDPVSEDGFQNSSEVLQMSGSQYATYLKLNRNALNRATVRGERPESLYWGVSTEEASADIFAELAAAAAAADPENKDPKPEPPRRRRGPPLALYKNTETGQTAPSAWSWQQATDAWAPTTTRPAVPVRSDFVTVLPVGHQLTVDLGDRLPEEGTLRVRIRAWGESTDPNLVPSLALDFGWQADEDWRSSSRISRGDLVIDGALGEPKFYQWDIPLSEIYNRNPARKMGELGDPKLTNPSEYIRLHNTSLSASAGIQLDYIEVSSPVYDQWPTASHVKIFGAGKKSADENASAREIVSRFMKRAWRRTVSAAEVDRKMAHFARIRPVCDDFEQAVVETLTVVLSSPHFLYLIQTDGPQPDTHRPLDPFELATRMAMFLWCSTPDDELIDLAATGRLNESDELVRQAKRMLADPRHERFSKHFVRQWLDLGILDFLNVDEDTYPEFDDTLKASMQQEPVAFFAELLQHDRSVLDFIHADYALVNQRLAQHYGISDVYGQHFRKVPLQSPHHRGGILTQAGLLAMNSDGKDSNPLQRGIWILERILNDPPPPAPPVVPEIDLTDPAVLQMTLKERMEDHRNDPACYSCHAKIDPWGIALENFDAVGGWRTEIQGEEVDAASRLFNQQELDGIEGLKRYLLTNRQDQFTRAMVYKLATFALGRPLGFSDYSGIERLTAELRKEGDGLATLVSMLVTSELFKSR